MNNNLDKLINDLYLIMVKNKVVPSKMKLNIFFLIWFLIMPFVLICYGLTIVYAKLWILLVMVISLAIVPLIVSFWIFSSPSVRNLTEENNKLKLLLWPDGFSSSQDAREELDALVFLINERMNSRDKDKYAVFKMAFVIYSTVSIPVYYQIIKQSSVGANIAIFIITTIAWAFCIYTMFNFTDVKAIYNYESYKAEKVVEELKKFSESL